jgi:protein-glutamine gamma-glutamyltransferase
MSASTGIILMNIDHRTPTPIVVVLAVVIGPLLVNLPLWVTGWCLVFWGYALMGHHRGWPWPGRATRLILTGIGCMAILIFLGGVSRDSQAFIGLLCVMAGLKPLEMKNHRDRVVTLFMAYFIIIISLFSIENLLITLYMFVSVLATTTCLVHFNHPERPIRANLRLVAVIMLQAIPLMVLLFFLFPRLEGTFFSLPGRYEGRTGFSESLRPGSISRLVQEDRTAFRVQFERDIPEAAALYWRGMVLWHFDGKFWTQGSAPGRNKRFVRGRKSFQYDIILEPHMKRHLFALDIPVSTPPFTTLTEDFTLTARWPVRTVQRYRVRSAVDVAMRLKETKQHRSRQLPGSGNLKSRDLAETWVSQFGSHEAVLDHARHFFSQTGFSYTLNPPLLGDNPVDEFLFGTRSGYCEHYASAFAFLMRAAGIPARVVLGYLGGELNPYGNYLIVKQYHAHAWVEVFLTDQGWIRIDPTALVAPQRISMGIVGSLAPDDLPDFLARTGIERARLYIKRLAFMWDAVNLKWNAWFMEYSRIEQTSLLRGIFSTIDWRRVFWATGLAGVFVGLAVFAWIRFRNQISPGKRDIVKEAYDLFCHKLERVGIQRDPAQGPVDFARMAGLLRPESKEHVTEIIDTYIALRYRLGGGGISPRVLQRIVKRFDPQI